MSIKIPKTISAAVLYKTRSKLKVVNDLLLPELKKGQVLVKMFYSGLCHSQLMEINGERNGGRCEKRTRSGKCRRRKFIFRLTPARHASCNV